MKHNNISVIDYHQHSKHRLQQYANGPHGLDWATQPNPFREFAGCPQIKLPLATADISTAFNRIYQRAHIASVNPDLSSVAALFELAMGLSAWKVYGNSRWALRNNPSSGNLHPTESYLLGSGIQSLAAGVYHYHSYAHCLEQRCRLDTRHTDNFFLVALTSIHWREAWKYGERAYRYCQHDVGHAIAAFSYAAATLGWQVELLDNTGDEHINALLGLNRTQDFHNAEAETADVLLQIHTTSEHLAVNTEHLVARAQSGDWRGQANSLSRQPHIDWPIIDDISYSCIKPQTAATRWTPAAVPDLITCSSTALATAIIRQRRSAQAFDGQSTLPLQSFYRLLDCLLPRDDTPPLDSLHWPPRIHLAIFIHRVAGLAPGLYVLARSMNGENILRENLNAQFDWIKPDTAPEHLWFYQLATGNSESAARVINCHQNIAADSAFSLGMLAEFDNAIVDKPWQYRQLFWEAGMIGQILYLEAEAAGVRATGIGCYFDDSLHEMLGIESLALQSMYHFTVGTAIMDERIMTEPAYAHLKNRT